MTAHYKPCHDAILATNHRTYTMIVYSVTYTNALGNLDRVTFADCADAQQWVKVFTDGIIECLVIHNKGYFTDPKG